MKRLQQWLLNGVKATSLVLFLAIIGLWIGSYFRGMEFGWHNGRVLWDVTCSRGECFCDFFHPPPPPHIEPGWGFHIDRQAQDLYGPRTLISYGGITHFDAYGFAWYSINDPGTTIGHKAYRRTAIFWPCWAMTLPTAVPPALWIFQRVMQKRRQRNFRRRGLCVVCGYDLFATPNLCPECGTPVSATATIGKLLLLKNAIRQRNGAIIWRLLALIFVFCVGVVELIVVIWMLDAAISIGVAWPPYWIVADLTILTPTATVAILLVRSINKMVEGIGQKELAAVKGPDAGKMPGAISESESVPNKRN